MTAAVDRGREATAAAQEKLKPDEPEVGHEESKTTLDRGGNRADSYGDRDAHIRQPGMVAELVRNNQEEQHAQISDSVDSPGLLANLASVRGQVMDSDKSADRVVSGPAANAPNLERETIGSDDGANVGNSPLPTLAYDPFAKVGKVLKMPILPRLADAPKPFQLNELQWYKSAHKPPAPKGFYWQASGSKTEKVGRRKKKIAAGWLLIKSGNCQGCGDRYRPPITYLKGSAWATLQGESYGRQCAEIKLLLGKSRGRFNDLRCPKCVPRIDGQMPIADAPLRSRGGQGGRRDP